MNQCIDFPLLISNEHTVMTIINVVSLLLFRLNYNMHLGIGRYFVTVIINKEFITSHLVVFA